MKKLTVIIDHHAGSRLLGVLSDFEKIQQIKDIVKNINQESYIKFYEVELNQIDIERIQKYTS